MKTSQKKAQQTPHDAAWWCEHAADAIAAVNDADELLKRHRQSLERLHDSLTRLLQS